MVKQVVLVTGAAGFMGSHLVDELILMGYRVVAVDDLSGGFKENVSPQAEFVRASVSDAEAVEKIFKTYKPSLVYHLAAYAAEGLSHFIRRYNYTNNLIGSVNLINEAVKHKVKCFVFTSSIAVYGRNQLPMTEELTPLPEDPYGIAKQAVELDLRCAQEMFGLPYIVFRPHNVYGERQNIADPYRNVIGIFMNQVMRDEPMTIYGDGQQTRAFSYIRDVAPVIAGAPFKPEALNRVFNIGADQPYTVTYLAERVAFHMGKLDASIIYLPARKEVTHAYASHDLVKEVFNYAPKFSFDEGLEKMAKWVRGCGPRQPKIFDSIEIKQNMPANWAALIAG
jgi:UDP-glucose 4-epimerase